MMEKTVNIVRGWEAGMNSFERRHFIRAAVDFPICYELEGHKKGKGEARTLNISIDGIMFSAEDELELDAVLLLQFPPEWTGGYAVAKIIRREGCVYGCQFVDLQPSMRHELDQAIYRHWRGNVHKALPAF
jgi:hypothetical protein